MEDNNCSRAHRQVEKQALSPNDLVIISNKQHGTKAAYSSPIIDVSCLGSKQVEETLALKLTQLQWVAVEQRFNVSDPIDGQAKEGEDSDDEEDEDDNDNDKNNVDDDKNNADDDNNSADADPPLQLRMKEVVDAISKLEIGQEENTERITTAVHGAGNRLTKCIVHTLWASISKLTEKVRKIQRKVQDTEALANDAVATARETSEVVDNFNKEFLRAKVFDEFADSYFKQIGDES